MGNLVMKDGHIFPGEIIGNAENVVGEVVFNTSMVGYEGVLTDPSYKGQIVVFTYPSIGNYGFEMLRGKEIYPSAIVIQNSWVNEDIFAELNQLPLVILMGVDTRKVADLIRDNGSILGKVIDSQFVDEALKQLINTEIVNPVADVTCKEHYSIKPTYKKVAVLDLGIKEGILNQLIRRNLSLEVFPAFSNAKDLLNYKPDGVFLSNGPGDPRELETVVNTIRELIGEIPIMGVCLGHQLLSLALGCEVEKLKQGHRGGNHGVKDMILNKTYFTTQNHGYGIKKESVETNELLEISHVNLNDGTVEGIVHKKHPIFSVQFHPEGAPSNEDTEYLFDKFIDSL